jgi:quercetin dioxygenase-like cupin family protein
MLIHSPAGSDRAFRAAHESCAATEAGDVVAYAELLAPYGIHFDDQELENDERTNDELPAVEFDLRAVGDLDRLRELFADRPGIPRLVATDPVEYDAAAAGATRRKELLNGDVSAGTAMINMLSGVPGMNASAHYQPTEEEFFFVTGGRLTVTCATSTKPVGVGAFVFAPRNCTHGFSNDTESDARFVTLNSPAGHERALAMMRRLAEEKASKEQLMAASAVGGWVVHDPDALASTRR